jgi:hypothetical protein
VNSHIVYPTNNNTPAGATGTHILYLPSYTPTMQLKRRRGEEKPPAESPSSSSVRPVTRRQAAPTPKGADLDAADAYPTPAGSQRCPPASPSSTRSRTKGAEARTPAKSPPPRAPTTPRKSPQQRMTELPAIPGAREQALTGGSNLRVLVDVHETHLHRASRCRPT